MKIAN